MRRRILTVALAILLAVLGTAGVLAYVHQADTRALAGQKAVSVLVATEQIPSGTTASAALQGGMLTKQNLPAASVPADAIHSITPGLANLVMSTTVRSGQLLLVPMLVPATEAVGGLAIPTGMVAVTIQLCLPEVVAGNIQPGSEVAVFDTYSASGALTAQPNCDGPHQQQDFGAAHTRIVLPKVLVLSVGGSTAGTGSSSTTSTAFSQSSSNSASSTSSTVLVTLAVFQDNAERLIQLAEAGLPYLALLSNSSVTKPDTSVVPLLPPLK